MEMMEMKKKIKQTLIITIFLMLAAAILVSCGDDNEEGNGYIDTAVTASPTPPPIVIQQAQTDPTPTPAPLIDEDDEPHEVTREDFIDELDNFMLWLEEAFLYFDIVYRRFGVDFRQQAELMRAIISDEGFEIDVDIFTQLMLDHFFLHPDITYPVANWSMAMQSQRSDGFDGVGAHVITEVLEEGRIGYIRINCFELRGFGVGGNSTRMVRNFFSDSADFEHIIIDVRGVDRGTPDAWENTIIAPNIDREFTQNFYAFARDVNWLTSLFVDMTRHAAFAGAQFGIDNRIPIGEIFAIAEMDAPPPYLNLDMGLMYGLRYSRTIAPPDDATPFAGQIWLLIDGGVGGSVAQFVSLANYTGVATLVGQPVGGDMALMPFYFITMNPADWDDETSLGREAAWLTMTWPNVRMPYGFNHMFHTDHLGRPLCEYVTQPHVHVPDGVDALEYLLDLIGN